MTLRATTVVRFACTLLAAAAGCSGSNAGGERRIGSESVVVSMPEVFGALERPAVEFDHAKHGKAVEDKCETCHREIKPGQLSLRTVSLDGGDRNAVIDAYHEQCRGCHAKLRKQKLATGPMMCGDCHVKPGVMSPRREIAFAGSLHDQHVEIAENNCATCHHYSSGTNPPACRSCHGATSAPGEKPTAREAYHTKCIGCHRTMGLDPGCSYCHDKASKEKPI